MSRPGRTAYDAVVAGGRVAGLGLSNDEIAAHPSRLVRPGSAV